MRRLLNIFLLLLMTMTVNAEELDFSFPVSFQGAKPTIGDFVTAICNREEPGEWMTYVGEDWERNQRGEQTKGRFKVSCSKGYMTYVEQDSEDGYVHKGTSEFRCWPCKDCNCVIVAETSHFYRDGVAYVGQYDGLSLYLYDPDSRRMDMVYLSDYGMEGPEIDAHFIYTLTRKGITGIADKPDGSKYRVKYMWNGKSFAKTE